MDYSTKSRIRKTVERQLRDTKIKTKQMDKRVWIAVLMSIIFVVGGLIGGYIALYHRGIFTFTSSWIIGINSSVFWTALSAIGTLGAWGFLYNQNKATQEQLKGSQIAIYRAEIKASVEQAAVYLMDGSSIRYDRLSWINAALEIDNIEILINLLPTELKEADTERFGRLLDSKLPENLFENRGGGTSLLANKMMQVHKLGKGRYERCDSEFAGQMYLRKVYMFTREYEFKDPRKIPNFKFRRDCFFYQSEDTPKFLCVNCSNTI